VAGWLTSLSRRGGGRTGSEAVFPARAHFLDFLGLLDAEDPSPKTTRFGSSRLCYNRMPETP
jgi:hypothetical protein